MGLDEIAESEGLDRSNLRLAQNQVDVYKRQIVDGPEGMNGQFKYGDRRNCTGWATLPIVGATWNHDVQTRFGEMYGEDALYASIPVSYTHLDVYKRQGITFAADGQATITVEQFELNL